MLTPASRFLVGIAAFAAMPTNGTSQTTWLDRRTEVSELEQVTSARIPLTIRVRDDRRFQQDQFGLSGIHELIGRLAAAHESGTVLAEADLPSGVLTIGYYGLYRTGGGTWGSRFFGELTIAPQSRNQEPLIVKISADELIGRREPKGSDLSAVQASLTSEVEDELMEAVLAAEDVLGAEMREVIAFGRAPLASGSPEEALDAAVLDALTRGLELAWGTEVVNTVRIQDFGNAHVETTRRESGAVRAWTVLEEYTSETDDGFITVLVQAILVRPNR